MANADQLAKIKEGTDAWNEWRQHNAQEEIDLSGADLSKANLFMANLSGADLSGANLSGADLSEADLTHDQLDSAKR